MKTENKTINDITTALKYINHKNKTAENFELLELDNFTPEYTEIIKAVNQCIKIGNDRMKQERNTLTIINDIIRSGMWSMEFNDKGEMTKVNWSQRFREMLGFKDIIEFPNVLDSWINRLHPEDKPAVMAAFWYAIEDKKNYDIEYRVLTKEKGYKWYHSTGKMVQRQDGTPSLFVGTFIGITKKKEHETLIQEKLTSQAKLEVAMEETRRLNEELKEAYAKIDTKLRRTLSEEEQYKQAVLSGAYLAYNVNISRNLIEDEIFELIDGELLPVISHIGMKTPCNSDLFYKNWSKEKIADKDKHKFVETMKCENLKNAYQKGDRAITFDYQTLTLKDEVIILRHTILLTKDMESGDIIAQCHAKNIAEQELKDQQYKHKLKKQNDILSALSSGYQSIYRVNLDTDKYENFTLSTNMVDTNTASIENGMYFSSVMELYIQSIVEDQDSDYVRFVTSKDYILKQFNKCREFSVRYHVKDTSKGEHFEIHCANVSEHKDEHIAIIGFRNVDALIRQEEKYRLATQRDLEETLEGARTGIWRIELEDECEPKMYADKTMRMLLGVGEDVSPEECYGHWFSRIDEEYVEQVQKIVRDILQIGRAEVSYSWNHPTLGQIYVRCGGVADKNYEKKGKCLKGYHQDITETVITKKQQENELTVALMEAKRANAAKTEFLSHMSHDIRTPINGILGMLDIAKMNPNDEERKQDCMCKIRTAAQHLLSLVNDVLDISKLESGKTNFSKEVFNLKDLLENCATIIRGQAEERNIHVITDYESIKERIVNTYFIGSPLHIRQIIINIAGNSVKYNKPMGSIIGRCYEQNKKDGISQIIFEISDTGIGMSEDFLQHIFEPFTQEHNDGRTQYIGTGLGMAITKNLVEQMGGTISVESELGVGSKFSVLLPLKIAEEPIENKKQDSDTSNYDITGMKILLAEDNELNREIAEYMLENAGVTVVHAVDGKEAVDIFTSSELNEFDCILMDVMMPIMDGLEATRTIRELDRPDAHLIPIFAMTANAFAEDIDKVKKAGMNEHFAKPLEMEKMFHFMASYRR